jgi:hypothetical protein
MTATTAGECGNAEPLTPKTINKLRQLLEAEV